MSDIKNSPVTGEYQIGCAKVRIHGQITKERVEQATIDFLRKVERIRNAKKKDTTHGDKATYFETYGFIPFFRLDHNKKQFSLLKTVKPLIDDYDLMASSLSNNLIDFDTPIHVIKGFQGNDLTKLQQNLKTKKIIGVDEDGDVEIKTVDIPYQARQAKLELDEKNIYRFGMGLNMSGLKDTSATTNIAIKAMYSLLELRAKKLELRLKQFLRKLVKVVVDEINEQNHKNYNPNDVYFAFGHSIMSNEQENAQIRLTDAQCKQIEINTLMSLRETLDDETLIKAICEALDIDYEEIKDKLPEDEEKAVKGTQDILDGVNVDE